MSESRIYQIRQCLNNECRFRYPTLADDPRGVRCPRCQAETEIAATISASDEQTTVAKIEHQPAPKFAALLDNIRSVYNVGSIFRTADGAGIDHLYLCGITPTPAHPKLAKTSLRAEQHVTWSYHPNAVDLVTQLRDDGTRILALEETPDATSIFDYVPTQDPAVLVVGNEQIGIDPGVLALCDASLVIPMHGIKRSLNVATAFGIAAYTMGHGLGSFDI